VKGLAMTKKWFRDNVEVPMAKNGILITLRLVRINNTLKKPGPVFIAMARAAYDAGIITQHLSSLSPFIVDSYDGLGAEYFYRINDDTELGQNWPLLFSTSIQALKPPYGVIGT
jgi:hypothetical protein